MTPESVMTVARQALELTLLACAPILLTALVVGLAISLIQAVTQINEATLSFLPKLIGVALALVLAGPWIIALLVDYLRQILTSIPQAVG
jgi:flagellar biosynthesis protein FliQ